METEANGDDKPQDVTITSLDDSIKGKKRRIRPSKNLTIAQFSCRHPEWTYLHLKRVSSKSTATAIDETTVSLWIDAALGQFLGLHGRAISVDFLKLDGQDIYIRIPHQDQPAMIAALSGWIGRDGDALRTVGWSSWDANAYGHDAGQDLFSN